MIGDRVRRVRELAGVSARELSRLAGLTAPHVSLIESGERPNLESWVVANLATATGCTTDYLLFGDPHPEPTEDAAKAAVGRARASLQEAG